MDGISGMGGIGKTELALLVAERLRHDYPDAQFFINLQGTDASPRSPEEAIAICIRAFIGPEAKLHRRGEGATLGNLGIAYKNLGETRRAIQFFERHLAITR